MNHGPWGPDKSAELEELRARLAEAEEVLRAIRGGEVDAVVVSGARGEQIYTLSGADAVYRQLIETMGEGAATLSGDGVILYCNVRLAEMLRRPLQHVVGSALRSHLSPADQPALDAILMQARTAPGRGEINLTASDGHEVPVYVSAARLWTEVAQMVFCLVLTDLTEQRSHERIAAMERQARLILDQAAEAIVVCDEAGRVVRLSEAAQRLCDGSPLLRPFAEKFELQTEAGNRFDLASVLRGETPQNMEVSLERGGREVDLILNAGPLLSEQRLLGCVVTLTDITERKRAEVALAESEGKLKAIFDAAADGILLVEIESKRPRSANGSMCRMLGYSAAEILDLRIADLHPKAVLPAVTNALERLAKGEFMSAVELPMKRKDGSVFLVDLNSTPVRLGGRPFVVAMFRDITERKEAERKRQYDAERLRRSLEEGITAVARTVEMKDPYTAGHQRRVATLAVAIANEMGLPEEQIHGLHLACTLHDVGKVMIPAELLTKPGKLTALEFSLIKTHAQAGYEILKDVEFPWPIAEMVRQHHERMDGSGYPQGLRGEQILLETRILSVADMVEAMSAHRPYRTGLGLDAAMAELRLEAGTKLDPRVVSACERVFRERGFAFAKE